MAYTKRFDGREDDETRKVEMDVDVIPRADGSATFSFGDTVSISAVYGPKEMHPRHLENPEKGVLRCNYDMLSFSVAERKKPGPNRRSSEISYVSSLALSPVIQLKDFPNTVIDVHIEILQADASTRCAGINAASIALASAGIPMTDMIAAVSVGKIGGKIVVDVSKEEEDYEEKGEKDATDIALAFLLRSGKISLLQADGKITPDEMKEAIEAAYKACVKIGEKQKDILRKLKE